MDTRIIGFGLFVMRAIRLPAKLVLLGGMFAVSVTAGAVALGQQGAQRDAAIAVAVAAAVLWAYLATAFWIGIVGGLANAIRQLELIEKGQLDCPAEANGNDEIAHLVRVMARLTTGMSRLVADVRTSSALVAQEGGKLARNYRDLAARTEQQAASLQQTAAGVKQLVSIVQQNARNAAEADSKAVEVRAEADAGARSMTHAVDAIGSIQSDTKRIQEIVTVIDSIAFQTNILALNAAVEAARAGEQGRGFAVVAGEVRRLAQRCSEESHQIRDVINASAEHVDEGVGRIRAAGGGISGVADGVRVVAQRMSQISSASAEQSTGLDEIASAVTDLDGITQRNAHMVEEAANQATYLKERAATLSSSVMHFRLLQGTAAEAIALVDRAQAAYAGRTRQQYIRHLTEPQSGFHDRDMYVFALDRAGTYLSFGGNPAKVGTVLRDIPGIQGDALMADIQRQGDLEPGWVEYDINNPLTGTIQTKMSYVMKLDEDLYIGCGVYKSLNQKAA